MKFIRESSEAEMVATFLVAEIDSHRRYDGCVKTWLNANGFSETLVRDFDLGDEAQNRARSRCLNTCRGWEDRTMLFQGFPQGLTWSLRIIEEPDLLKIKMINYEEWIGYAGGTRSFEDFARRIVGNDPAVSDLSTTQTVRAISERLESGGSVPAMIAVTPEDDAVIVIVEGHARTTARFITGQIIGAEVIIGTGPSDDLRSWFVY